MLRIRVVGTLVLAVALLTAACGQADVVAGDPQVEAGAPSATQAVPDDSSGTSDPAEADVTEPSDSGDATGAGSESPDDTVSTEDSSDSSPADVEALLASATTQFTGRSVRGEAAIELAPGFELSTNFESDTDGDLAATFELPPGLDPEFPGGAEAELRYVGGTTYVRPPVSAEALADLGVDEAWYVAESVAGGDPMGDAMGSVGGVMCIFPQAMNESFADCDPLGDTGAFLEAAREAEIVGREDVRDVETTRVRFLVSLRDLAGEALGAVLGEDDAEASEGGAFDDSASDPFAEGLEQIFGFLDADLEMEVWIDDENLIRRMAFDLASLFAGFAGPDVEVPSSLVTLEFYDFDADISVDAPPPEAILDDPGLIVGGDDFGSSSEDFEAESSYDDDADDDAYDDDDDDDYS